MTSYSWNTKSSNFESYCSAPFYSFSENLGGFSGNWKGGSMSGSESSVLDSERGELVKAPARVGKKSGVSEEKVMAALKSHSEAERRRRERINAHLTKLRDLVPCTKRMDKAALLANVISQVKQLKETALETSEGLIIPMDADEVRVELHNEGDGTFSFRASVCCDYRPKLMSDLRQALNALHLNIVKAEISTLGGRVKNVFVFTGSKDTNSDNAEARQLLMSSVHRVLSRILDNVSAAAEYSPRTTLPSKRRRISLFDCSSSSSRE